MKIAIPSSGGKLCMHFGHCDEFAVFDVDTDTKMITNQQLLTPPPHEPGVLPRWLAEMNVNIIIAGGMGQRAQQLFASNNIDVIVGAAADKLENLVARYLDGELISGENVCDH